MYKPKYIDSIEQIAELSQKERKELQKITDQYIFRTNEYYLSLINWDDPDDPIRRIVIPNKQELQEWGRLDASDEDVYTVVPGLEHKYENTALLLLSNNCAGYCRFCFRKRLFLKNNNELLSNIEVAIEYLRQHPVINNILLTGGDPLIMSTAKLDNIIRQLRSIKHIQIIRIGTKIPAYNPFRIINDASLLEMLRKFSTNKKKIYVMAHFNHPKELTEDAIEGINLLIRAETVIVNQTPLIRNINDDHNVLASLFNKLSYIGVPPYYLFICRPTKGNKAFAIPIEKAFDIFEKARMQCSGLAKRARLVMSHSTGKIEIVGKSESHIYMRYHRASNPQEKARFMIFKRNPDAYWFDDYEEVTAEYSNKKPYRCFGPE